MMDGQWMEGPWMNGLWMGGAWLFGLLVIAGVVLLIVLLLRVSKGGIVTGSESIGATSDSGSARQILDERYARGELTTEEYQERLRVLGEGR